MARSTPPTAKTLIYSMSISFTSDRKRFFYGKRVAYAGDACTLLGARRRHERTRRRKQNAAPLALGKSAHDKRAEHRCRASAARAARVNVLPLAIEDQNATVGVKLSELNSVAAEKHLERGVPDGAEVAGHDHVVIVRISAGVGKMRL